METVCTENAKVDGKGREISQYCLGLPTILRRIVGHFSTKELLELSLVNKLWNFEARSVMRERGNLTAYPVKYIDHPETCCQKLAAFGSDLEKMRIVPFTGLNFTIYHHDACRWFPKGSLHPAYKIILDRLPWKYLSVRFCKDWDNYQACPALLLVETILKDHCEVLEELSLQLGHEEFLRTVFQDRSLPRLKILKVEKRYLEGEHEFLSNAFVKSLVSSAPNLQELHVEDDNNFTEDLLEGSSAVLVPHGIFEPLFHEVCEGLIGRLRAETMEIYLQEEDVDPELLNRFIPKLLEASRASLKTLRMDFLFALPLMCYGICLENVTTLEIHMNCYSLGKLEPSILKLPSGLDFTRVFPKLTEVVVSDNEEEDFSPDVIVAFVEQATAVLSRALPDRATNIMCLKIDRCSSMDELTLPVLGQMFPHVKTVHAAWRHSGALMADLREHFPCLEERIENTWGMNLP